MPDPLPGDVDCFVPVAADCPTPYAVVPESAREPTPVHLLQYQLLSGEPYRYTLAELIVQVHVRRMGPEVAEAADLDAVRTALFERPHPCMRASMLPKRYGWGVHYDTAGRIALCALGSPEYERFVDAGRRGEIRVTPAMRNRRA